MTKRKASTLQRNRTMQSRKSLPPMWSCVVLILLVYGNTNLVDALSSSSSSSSPLSSSVSSKSSFPKTTTLESVEASQFAMLDGAEWASIKELLPIDSKVTTAQYGYMNVAVGKDSTTGQEIIGLLQQEDTTSSGSPQTDQPKVYRESVATIPSSVSMQDAIATYIAGFSLVHSVLPQVEQVGGSQESSMVLSGKVVVMGGNDLACFAAQGLSSLGVDVCLVSTGNPKVQPIKVSNSGKVEIMKPGVGSDKVGFAEHVGKFDSLLDTLNNERPLDTSVTRWRQDTEGNTDARLEEAAEEEEGEEEDSFALTPPESPRSVLTVNLLKTRHGCHRYVSTMTHCQSMVAKDGILGGPRQADDYAKRIGQPSFVTNSPNECQAIIPWSNLGTTVESMLNAGVIFPSRSRNKWYSKSKCLRGWNLADFWEQSTWPRDSSGNAQVRFGLPVVEDPNLEDVPMIAEAPSRPRAGGRRLSPYEEFDFSAKDDHLEDAPPKPVQENPFIHQVAGVEGVRTEIMEEELDCILFLSAKFCRTCRSINPQYTRMARIAKEQAEEGTTSTPITFAKAETSGRWGKELGRYLGVDAVPAFILYRKGERYGSPLSVSRLPSRKIDRALSLLESGVAWDPDVLRETDA